MSTHHRRLGGSVLRGLSGQQLRASGGAIEDGFGVLAQRGTAYPYSDVMNPVPQAVTGSAEEGGPAVAVQRRSSAALGAFERTRPMVAAQAIGIAADIASRLLTWRAAWMGAQRRPFEHAEVSMSKVKASEVAVRACEQAIQTMGGWGYIKDSRSRSGAATPTSAPSSRAQARSSDRGVSGSYLHDQRGPIT